ncbi:uncharacterized protein BT62DRAFT_274737 [Guyanagaster necrorhizus]|uniref:CXC domain-containing protein n=1 Tax=Guyanagaster necrorhizus TaxID=856835 RepID=A0A9P7W4H0_9AGAR|nr:uncharacterized protein BT62DRAFT_274737 [Guyanagaster necrorhizus MCA 3950]KAG7451988.1 hypothetical protein BT62DRAFT_274737 [Guyanagaster necrorhizus MCA 3950]
MDIDREVVLSTRSDVFDQFYVWEQEEARAHIQSLAVDDGDDDGGFDVSFENKVPISEADSEATGEIFSVWSCDDQGVPTSSSTVFCIEITVSGDFEPHPPYLACTPASRSAEKESFDMTLSAESLPFIPFADDPSFPLAEYLGNYESFEWQVDFVDPDVEVLEIEVARRLHCEFGLSLDTIDELKIMRPMRISHESGLVWDTFQRDMPNLPWLDEPIIMTLPPRKLPNENDLLNEINRFRPQFCPNMNCIHLACKVHQFEYPPIKSVTSTKTNQSFKLRQGTPCGLDCYRHLDESQDGMMEGVLWTDPEDEEFLCGVLKLDPDISPCALAVICRKRCLEVYIYRTRNIPDEKVIIGERKGQSQGQRQLVFYDDDGMKTYVPIPPCGHPGPCDANSNCQCYHKSHHCQRNCRCGLTCPRRREGCGCTHEKKTGLCSNEKTCTCVAGGRECDPELCLRCDARYVFPSLSGESVKHWTRGVFSMIMAEA